MMARYRDFFFANDDFAGAFLPDRKDFGGAEQNGAKEKNLVKIRILIPRRRKNFSIGTAAIF
ncbi:MAG TPA: hypothetical protein VGM58_10160 [Verrucomicrobiae bacterium]|jgi:hypothetical protein